MEYRALEMAQAIASKNGFGAFRSLLLVEHCDVFHAMLRHFQIPDMTRKRRDGERSGPGVREERSLCFVSRCHDVDVILCVRDMFSTL